MATPLTDAINALTTYANSVTGASDTTLSDAVDTLAAGYGGGGGGSIPKLVEQVNFTPETTLTNTNRASVQLTAMPNKAYMVVVYVNSFPAADESETLALLYNAIGSSGSAYTANGIILRVNGTIGTDGSMCSYNRTTGIIQIGGQYGHFREGTTYTILLFDLS